ncbi:hypothetical protein FSOLCH5_013337 [Fusarium solani]
MATSYSTSDPASHYQPQQPTLHGQLRQQLLPQLQQQEQSFLPDVTADAATAPPPVGEKPYHSKRPHKKSRTGCRNCKARKVKCDEGQPVCRSCKLRNVECIYPALGCQQTLALNDSFPFLTQPLWHPSNIDVEGMKLLWFYTTFTSSSFSVAGPGNPVDNILNVRMVQVAFETPFLMDSLFALSNLHMQNLDQNCDPSHALAYRARFLEGYRRAVEAAAPETYVAIMASSIYLTVLSSQAFREKNSPELYILDWMVIWRGISLIIDQMGVENIFDTGMYALFERPAIDLEASTASIPNHLLFMVSSIKPYDPDYPDVATYHDTLKYLGSLYMYLREGFSPVMNLRIISWFTFLPRRFIDLARQRRPRALVIIAYYAAFLKLIKSIWWLKGVGERSLDDLCNYLGPEWEHLLLVPQEARDIDDELDLARTHAPPSP